MVNTAGLHRLCPSLQNVQVQFASSSEISMSIRFGAGGSIVPVASCLLTSDLR